VEWQHCHGNLYYKAGTTQQYTPQCTWRAL